VPISTAIKNHTVPEDGAARPAQGMFGKPLTRFRKVYSDPQLAWHGVPVNNGPALEIWERLSSP